ncbi:MAG: hypothetical protein VKJ27_00015 [Synechocystis sp.]|nr:hypothetical protein [Synechocystis sp.]
MTRSLAKIREQLTQLEAQTETQWHRLGKTYDQYVQHLSRTLQQQAVYAVYQICTQIYPEAFLQLSYNDRHAFQQSIRTAIGDFYDYFTDTLNKQGITLDPANPLPEADDELDDEETLMMLEDDTSEALDAPDHSRPPDPPVTPDSESPHGEDTAEQTEKDSKAQDENFPSMQEIKAFLSEALEKEGLSLEMLIPKMVRLDQTPSPLDVKTPDDLVQWHRHVEKHLQRSLVNLSMRLNHYLTTQKIIPENLPPKVLEMALQAEDERLVPNREKMPHIVNLLIETAHKPLGKEGAADPDDPPPPTADANEDEDDASDTVRGELSRLTVINLRATDLEFSDVNLSMIRKQLRASLGDLKKLRQQYRQLSQNKLSAEAELAWRSSWTTTESPTP